MDANYIRIPPLAAKFVLPLLKEMRDAKQKELTELDQAIASFGMISNEDNNASETPNENGYFKSWTWFKKVEFILGKYGELNTSAIFDKICLNEPELKPQRAKVIGSISAILSAKSKNEANMPFKKNENVRGEYVYSLNNKPPLNEGDLFEDIPGR